MQSCKTFAEAITAAKTAETTITPPRRFQPHSPPNYNKSRKRGQAQMKFQGKFKGNGSSIGFYCTNCKKNATHNTESCFIFNPEKRPAKRPIYNKPAENAETAAIDGRPTLPVSIENKIASALLDSGSTHSLINKDLLNYFDLDYNSTNVNCNSASGDSLNVIGKVNLKIQLTGLSPSLFTSGSFLLNTNCRIPLIFGKDFLKANKMVLDMANSSVICGKFSHSYDPHPENYAISDYYENKKISLLQSYNGLFIDKIGKANHTFKLVFKKEPPSFRYPAYRMPVSQLEDTKKHIDYLLKHGIISKETTAYVSPSFIVPKSDNTGRLVIDFKKTLNKFLERMVYPIPTIDDLLYKLQPHTIKSKLDIKSGFYHILLAKESRKYTGFSLPFGTYVWNRMPMGISPAIEAFQEFMHLILGHLPFLLIYIDDILIISANMEIHLQHLEIVFKILQENDLVLKKSKCKFAVTSLDFLGFLIGPEGIQPNPDKVESILNIPPPTNKSKLKGVLGAIGFFRRFIPNLSSQISILTDMLKSNVEFQWDSSKQEVLDRVLRSLAKMTLLYYPDFKLPFEVMTDASDTGIGAFVYQMVDASTIHSLYFYSKKLTDVQVRNMSIVEKEAFAIAAILEYLHTMLYGQQINVYCDNLNVTNIHNTKSKPLHKLYLRINEYAPNIKHIDGKQNGVADYLSRLYEDDPVAEVFAIDETFPLSFEFISKHNKKTVT